MQQIKKNNTEALLTLIKEKNNQLVQKQKEETQNFLLKEYSPTEAQGDDKELLSSREETESKAKGELEVKD